MMLLSLLIGLTIHGALHAADTQLVRLTSAERLLYDAATMVVPEEGLPMKFNFTRDVLKTEVDIKKVQATFKSDHDPLMYNVVLAEEEDLLRLLLEKGANAAVYATVDSKRPLLWYVKTMSIAKLLLESDAHVNLTAQEKYNVFARAMCKGCEVSLVELYTSYGFKSTSCHWSGGSLLMQLALNPHENMILKAQALLKGLTHEQKVTLIKLTDCLCYKDVFDDIDKQKNEYRLYNKHSCLSDADSNKAIAYLEGYEKFLKEQLQESQRFVSEQNKVTKAEQIND